jgi:hypothetical protein
LVFVRFFTNPFNLKGPREGANEFSLTREERMAPVQIGGSYRYVLTRVQALELYEKAVSMFTAYRDDAARVSLNRILESNAADGLKNRARIIISYLETPGFNDYYKNDNVAFAEVKKDPMLYNGVHVIWRGTVSVNSVKTSPSGGTSFDFLVGYDRKTLEGVIAVTFNYTISFNPERPIEILGKVIPDDSHEGFSLEGVNFHQSFTPDN